MRHIMRVLISVLSIFICFQLLCIPLSAKIIFKDDFNAYTTRWEPPYKASTIYPCPNPPCQHGQSTFEPSPYPKEQRNNQNSWNGWIYNDSQGTISIELDKGRNGTPCLQIGYPPDKSTSAALGLHKWLNDGPDKGGYDEIYVRFYFKFDNNWRFGSNGSFNYWKWMRFWAGVNLLDENDYNGFIGLYGNNEAYFGHTIVVSSSSSSPYQQYPFYFVTSHEGVDSSVAPYIRIPGVLRRVSDSVFTLANDTDYSYLKNRQVSITVNNIKIKTEVVDVNYRNGMNTISIKTPDITADPTEFAVKVPPYQFSGPTAASGNVSPYNYHGVEILHPGQFPYHLGPLNEDGTLVRNGLNGKPCQDWHWIEFHIKLRDGALSEDCKQCVKTDCSDVCGGSANTGIFEMWIDGEKVELMKYVDGRYDYPSIPITTNVDGGISYIRFMDNSSGLTAAWGGIPRYFWIDDIVISTDPIGPVVDAPHLKKIGQ